MSDMDFDPVGRELTHLRAENAKLREAMTEAIRCIENGWKGDDRQSNQVRRLSADYRGAARWSHVAADADHQGRHGDIGMVCADRDQEQLRSHGFPRRVQDVTVRRV